MNKKLKYVLAAGLISAAGLIGATKAEARGIYEKKDDSQKTEITVPVEKPRFLPDFEWVSKEGNVQPIYNNKTTGTTATSSVIKVTGSAKMVESKSIKEKHYGIRDPKLISWDNVKFRAVNKYTLEEMLKVFDKNNPYSKRQFHKEDYGDINIADKLGNEAIENFDKAIKDGELTAEEFSNQYKGFYGILVYGVDDKGTTIASTYHLVRLTDAPKTEKLEEKAEKHVEEQKVEEPLDKEVSKKLVSRFGFGADWNINELIIPHFRYMLGIPVDNGYLFPGLEIGVSGAKIEQPDQVTTTPEDPITGFYGHGVTKKDYNPAVFEALASLTYTPDTAKWLNAGLAAGISYFNNLINTTDTEQIRNRAGSVVAENVDSYTSEDSRLRLKILGELGFNTFGEDVEVGVSGRFGGAFDFVNPEDSKAVIGLEAYLKY